MRSPFSKEKRRCFFDLARLSQGDSKTHGPYLRMLKKMNHDCRIILDHLSLKRIPSHYCFVERMSNLNSHMFIRKNGLFRDFVLTETLFITL